MTLVLAVYAAVTATAGIGWQVFTWHRSHGTRLTVSLTQAIAAPNGDYYIGVVVTNKSEHLVNIIGAGFNLQDGSGRTLPIIEPTPMCSIPGKVAARDSGSAFLLGDAAASVGLDAYHPMVGWVDTGAHGRIKSRPQTLRTRT